MRRLVCLLLVVAASPLAALTLSRTISREDPGLDLARCRLNTGRDGFVYLAGDRYVLRVSPDGHDKLGGAVAPALWNVAANRAGVIATANAHFQSSVYFWAPSFAGLGRVSDFLSSDPTEWFGPCDVQAGESDFYGLDQNRDRLVRVAAPDRLVTSYPLRACGESFVRRVVRLRVWEAGARLYLATDKGDLHCLGFDGTKVWTLAAGLGGNPWDGYRAAFDVDERGGLWILPADGARVRRFDADLKPLDELSLGPGAPAGRVTHLALLADAIVVKRQAPRELFSVYDRASGALRHSVRAEVEQLDVTLPGDVLTAGTSVPLAIAFDPGRARVAPRWRVWLRPVTTPRWRELAWRDGQVALPADLAGLYQLRVGPGLDGAPSEYQVQTVVEFRAPGATGAATVMTPSNRLYHGAEEPVKLSVIVRGAPASAVAGWRLTAADGQVVRTGPAGPTWTIDVPLAPGAYQASVDAPGLTVMAQPLLVGPGAAARSPFSIVSYGDYGPTFAGAGAWETPETVADHLARCGRLGLNFFVDRLGHGGGGQLDQVVRGNLQRELADRLRRDPLAVAPEKADWPNALHQTLAGYSAQGAEQMAILLYMDAGLPIGTSFDKRTREQFTRDITTVSQGLSPYPAFRGWSWAANWWHGKLGANAAANAEERTAYDQALQRAKDTGAWDPVLDTVSDRWLAHAVEAQTFFNGVLDQVAPGKVKACAGPYRSVGVYPPSHFAPASEVDLQYQAEQIQPPQVTGHNVDWQKRPGKRAWGHPELWNDAGTGGQIVPSVLQMVMRGADGVGLAGTIPPWRGASHDPRGAGPGMVSVWRALNGLLRQYGPWLTTLANADRVAILVGSRMARLDEWARIGGRHFDRLFQAWQACLHAHRPASFVFVEDLESNTLDRFAALLLVDERVALEPAMAKAVAGFRARGKPVFADGTCRAEVVAGCTPLGVAFDRLERDPSAWQDDAAYARLPALFAADGRAVATALAAVPPVATAVAPDVLLTERRQGAGRFVWAINNRYPTWDPGLMWRQSLFIANRWPHLADLTLAGGGTVYDVFAGRVAGPRASADLRALPARLYAVTPRPIDRVLLTCDVLQSGQPLRWRARVADAAGEPLATSLPVTVRLTAADGTLLGERYGAAIGAVGAAGSFPLPVNAPPGPLTLTATELCGGKCASLVCGRAAQAATGRAAVDFRPVERSFGPHLRDVALLRDGTAVFSALDWDHNLWGLDPANGAVRFVSRVGDGWAWQPAAAGDGFVAGAFDLRSAAGYQVLRLDAGGRPQQRRALPALPQRATSWCAAQSLVDDNYQVAVAPDGGWLAGSANLGLTVWAADGQVLWQRDQAHESRAVTRLVALDNATLVTLRGMTVTACDARTGAARWALTLGRAGALSGGIVAGDRQTLALSSAVLGGRVFVVRQGKLLATCATLADELALSADGQTLAVVHERDLKLFSTDAGLAWTWRGDDRLHHPAWAPDGQRLAVASELGTLTVLDRGGELVFSRDLAALAAPAWLPAGDLLVGTWMGTVARLDARGGERWRVWLQPRETDVAPSLTAAGVPLAASPPPLPALTPNLLTTTKALIEAVYEPRAHGDPRPWQQSVELLRDGRPDPPPAPWLAWTDINYNDSGWRRGLTLVFDTFRSQVRLDGITFVEDPAHPESWLRDARLQRWDAPREVWVDGPYLVSDAAVHTHRFTPPLEGARFRLTGTSEGVGWPAGNLRWGEVVCHGEVLGASHPDAVARRARAVLFDEDESDLRSLLSGHNPKFAFRYEGAASGGKCLALTGAGAAVPGWRPPFGHAVPNWDFPIVAEPLPGQYRWLRFAWRALSPRTTGMALTIGRAWSSGGYALTAGDLTVREGALAQRQVSDRPPSEWTTVTVDLWALYGKPVNIQSLALHATGDGLLVDRVVLGRSEADL